MKRLLIVAALLGAFALGSLTSDGTHLVFPSLLTLFAPPVSATYTPTPFKSMQFRTVAMATVPTVNDTIAAVNMSATVLISAGQTPGGAPGSAFYFVACFLTSTTNVACSMDPAGAPVSNVRYSVLEFLPGQVKSVQRCTIPYADGVSVGACTITATVIAKTWLSNMGYRSTNSDPTATAGHSSVLQNATTQITGVRNTASNGTGETSVFIVENK